MKEQLFVSLHNKEPYEPMLKELAGEGIEFIGTEGTANWCGERDLPCRSVVDVLDFAPQLGGQVKTLHPDLYQSLLGRPEGEDPPIEELSGVIVDLTPFRSDGAFDREAVDIGGISLLRAAAKNFPSRVALCGPEMVRAYLRHRPLDRDQRRYLARRVLEQTLLYDLDWRAVLGEEDNDRWSLGVELTERLRYGENPNQEASIVRSLGSSKTSGYRLIGDKGLSYTNCLDLEAARRLVARSDPVQAVAIKHTNPTGWASGEQPSRVVRRAWEGDPKSAFGGVMAVNRTLSLAVLDELEDYFLDRLLVPDLTPAARRRLEEEGSPRVAIWTREWTERSGSQLRSWEGGYLLQDSLETDDNPERWDTVTSIEPTSAQFTALRQAWWVVAATSSNAAVVARPGQVLGVGAGQQSRVDAVRLACEKAQEHHGELPNEAVLASDGFFPFPDNVEVAARHGVRTLVQPGGSVKDDEVIEAADKLGLSMMVTGQRVFRH